MNDIEKLKAYHSISCFLSEDLKTSVLEELGIDKNSLDKRMDGKNNEIEFCLLLKIFDRCKHIIAFEEGVSVLTSSYTPDLLIEMKDNKRFFIEIKSSSKHTYKISKGNLENRINFCKEFGYPLYFAIKFKNGFWTLFSSEYIYDNDGKIDFNKDYQKSMMQNIFNSKLVLFPPDLEIRSIYSNNLNHINSLGRIAHQEYGVLISYEIYYKTRKIFVADKETVIFSIILEELHDNMTAQYQNTTKLNFQDTLVSEKLLKSTIFQDFTFRLRPIYHVLEEDYNYDINRFFKEYISDKVTDISLESLYLLIDKLKKCNVPIEYVRSENYDFDK